MSTSTTRGLANPHIADRAAAYGIAGVSVDGNDFFAVRDAAASCAADARNGNGPALLECVTYRLSGHSRGDPRVYRSREEESKAWANDPILRLEARLKADGTLTDDSIATHRQSAQAHIDEAVLFAMHSPLPSHVSLTDDLFA